MPIRDWRKHNGAAVSSSFRLSKVSDQAVILWRSIVDWQGDDGEFPWERPKVRAMLAFRDWSSNEVDAALEELVNVGSIIRQDDWVILYKGHAYNGTVSGGSGKGKPRHWPGWTCKEVHSVPQESAPDVPDEMAGRTTDVQGTSAGRTTDSLEREERREREEKRREELGASPPDFSNFPLLAIIKHLTGFKTPSKPSEWEAKIRLSAKQYAIDPVELCREFAQKWPDLALAHERAEPVAFLRTTRGIEASMLAAKLRRAAPPPVFRPVSPNVNGSGQPVPDKYELERQRIEKLGVAPPRPSPKVPP